QELDLEVAPRTKVEERPAPLDRTELELTQFTEPDQAVGQKDLHRLGHSGRQKRFGRKGHGHLSVSRSLSGFHATRRRRPFFYSAQRSVPRVRRPIDHARRDRTPARTCAANPVNKRLSGRYVP